MPDFAPKVLTDLYTAISAAWPDVANARQKFVASQALEFNLLQIMDGVLTDTADDPIVAPYAVVEFGNFGNEKSLGVAQSKLYRSPIAIWYIDVKKARTANISDQQFVQSKLYALKEYLAGYQFESFYAMCEASMDSSHSCAINVEARAQQYEVVGGVLWWDEGLITGEHFIAAP